MKKQIITKAKGHFRYNDTLHSISFLSMKHPSAAEQKGGCKKLHMANVITLNGCWLNWIP